MYFGDLFTKQLHPKNVKPPSILIHELYNEPNENLIEILRLLNFGKQRN